MSSKAFRQTDHLLLAFREVMMEEVREDARDLSLRQLAALLTVYLTNEPQTVRGLAAHLKVSKPAVTRILDRLEEDGLARREPDWRDRRSLVVGRTAAGAAMVKRFKSTLENAALISA